MNKFKLFWQMESTDCGPACLQMVCAFYGKSVSQQYIKDGMSISRIGVTIRDIKDRASDLGFDTVVAKAVEGIKRVGAVGAMLALLLKCS